MKRKIMFSLQKSAKEHIPTMLYGNAVKSILIFSTPLIFSNLFVQLYSLIDSVVVGQFIGENAFAAIGAIGWITWILIALCRDSSNAICTQASYLVGQGNAISLSSLAFFAMIICGLFSILVLLLLSFTPLILNLLNVNGNISPLSNLYLQIYIFSIPFLLFNNIACALLRATGNSTVQFFSIVISTLVNIILDVLFVNRFHLGISGVAWATYIAQLVSCIIALIGLIKSGKFISSHSIPSLITLKSYCKFFSKLFIPMFFNSILIALGGLCVQSQINSVGTYFTAGTSACLKIFNILEAIIMAIMSGTIVFVGQNIGANNFKRVKKGVESISIAGFFITLILICIVWWLDDLLISMFLSKADSLAAFQVAITHTHIISIGMLVMTPMYLYRSSLQTMGYPSFPAIAGAFQFLARIFCVTILPSIMGFYAYYFTDFLAWIVTIPWVFIPFYKKIHQKIFS